MTQHKLKLHLARRAGFGLTEVEAQEAKELTYQQLVDRYIDQLKTPLASPPSEFNVYERDDVESFLMGRLVSGAAPLREKLALFWHDHFATSNLKVVDRQLMWNQYQIFREFGSGKFRDLLKLVARDVAMLRWLDGNSNRKGSPNENFARELMELFTLGVGHYTETDVKEAARAFTGWSCYRREFVFQESLHDTGSKTFLGQSGAFGGDQVIDIICRHPACSRFLARKLIQYFAEPEPNEDFVERVALVFRQSDQHLAPTLRAIFEDAQFKRPDVRRSLVKSPIELVATSLRVSGQARLPGQLTRSLKRMGQTFFYPPSVEGWTSGVNWLSAGGLVERLKWAHMIGRTAPRVPTDVICRRALDGEVDPKLKEMLQRLPVSTHWAVVLGSPQFQLS